LIAFLKFCGNFAPEAIKKSPTNSCDLIAFLKFCGNFARRREVFWGCSSCDLIAFLKFCGNFALHILSPHSILVVI